MSSQEVSFFSEGGGSPYSVIRVFSVYPSPEADGERVVWGEGQKPNSIELCTCVAKMKKRR
jgi:hypothetical protein